MIIGVDGNEANVEHKVGVSVYTLELLKYFAKHADKTTQFKIFLRNEPNDMMPDEGPYFSYEIVPGQMLWSQIFLPYHLRFKTRIDIFFAPAHYSPRFLSVPLVLTVHDLSYFMYPNEFLKKDLYKLTNWTKYSIDHAKTIIAVSKTTKKDILKWYKLKDRDVRVIYNGFRKRKQKKTDVNILKEYELQKKKYILYVGTLQPRKNIQTLIQAYAAFRKDHPDFKLVLAGKKGWLFDAIFREVQSHNLEEDVIFTGYTSDDGLIDLYNNAFCFVLPSFYEGFGIPILEAMSHNIPVISSHASSLPEIGSEACLYFDPHSADDLHEKLDEIYNDKNLYQNLITAGNARVTEFSWSKCAEETLQAIKNTIASEHEV
ncbi:glycosyltransferase family 4 protein [Candidatus Roizmanbacteria bacterium]|nr:MAG: glycosyltransferase family 4 protein [Candidatus Roizmanbacteria bacterium]